MGGTAMIIILQQLKGLLGLQHFTTKTDIVSVVHSVFANRHEWKWQSAVLGLGFLIILLLARRLKEKIPKLFWVNAITPLLVVVMGGIIAFSANGKDHGIPIEGIAVGRSLAILKNEQTDGNKEMIAFGMMNIVGSLTSCYLTTGPFSKSAVNYNAGCRSPMANVVMGICMMLVLLFLTPLFKYTPLVALAAIIVVAMLGLIEPHEMRHLFNVDKFDFCVCMAALLGVVFINMEVGLLLSVGLSIIRALLHVSRPISCKLGKVPGTQLYRDVEQYADSTAIPGILILQMGSPIYFANANYLKERIMRWVEEETNVVKEKGQDLQYVILDLGGVSAIDSTGIGMLFEIRRMLLTMELKVALTNPRLRVVEKLVAANFADTIGREWIFLSVKDAVSGCRFALNHDLEHA